jgi:hypothetical protein
LLLFVSESNQYAQRFNGNNNRIVNPTSKQLLKTITNGIYELRGKRVMLDKDLIAFYETETKDLNLIYIGKYNARFLPDLTQILIGAYF